MNVCSMTRPCKCGLAGRTKRLFGLTGTAGGEPCSPTVFKTKGVSVSRLRPPSTEYDRRRFEIQGVLKQALTHPRLLRGLRCPLPQGEKLTLIEPRARPRPTVTI